MSWPILPEGISVIFHLETLTCTRLYDATMDKQLIQEISGHHSNAARNYK